MFGKLESHHKCPYAIQKDLKMNQLSSVADRQRRTHGACYSFCMAVKALYRSFHKGGLINLLPCVEDVKLLLLEEHAHY